MISLSKGSRSGISTGWGLDFCQLVVEAHRGVIEVKSELGRGSTFTVVLPLKQESH